MLAELRAERDRLDRAIAAVENLAGEGPTDHKTRGPGRPLGSRNKPKVSTEVLQARDTLN